MSQFSVLLKQYIERSGKTIYHLAQKADVNRPMIHKSLRGDIVPNDRFIEQISNAMMLSVTERNELFDLAERARLGESAYFRHRMIDQMLNEGFFMADMELQSIESNQIWLKTISKEYAIIHSKNEIRQCFQEMLYQNEKPSQILAIHFYLPKNAIGLLWMIFNLPLNKRNYQIYQYVSMEKDYYYDDSIVRNMGMVNYAMEMALKFGNQYQCHYFYQDFPESKHSIGMPYFIRIPEVGILRLNGNLDTGAYYAEGEMTAYADAFIEELRKEAGSLLMSEKESIFNETEPNMFVFGLSKKRDFSIELQNLLVYFERIKIRFKWPDIVITTPREELEASPESRQILEKTKNYAEKHSIFCVSKRKRDRTNYNFVLTKKHEAIMYHRSFRKTVRICESNTVDALLEYVNYMMKGKNYERIN